MAGGILFPRRRTPVISPVTAAALGVCSGPHTVSHPHNQMEERARSIPDTLRPGPTRAHTYFGKTQALCQDFI